MPILLKRNFTTGSIPTTSSLQPGEIAVNVADGRLYVRQSGSLGNNIRSVPVLEVSNSGSLILTGSINLVSGSLTINSGSVTITSGSVTMTNRPAFRITGSSTPFTAGSRLSGSANIGVDYNQGGHFNVTNGLFTAPIAGLYQVNLTIRTAANNNSTINQAIVYKSGSGDANNVQIMVEFGTNTSMNHAGGSTITRMNVGDTLRTDIVVGTCTFDQNDNFSVAYIG